MRVRQRAYPPLLPDVLAKVDHDVRHALESIRTKGPKFIVNDSSWVGAGGKPLVMDQAEYLSRTFQTTLRDSCHWSIEQELEGEKIDAFTVAATTGSVAVIEPTSAPERFSCLWSEPTADDVDAKFSSLYQRFVKRRIFTTESLPPSCATLCTPQRVQNQPVRVGLAFETGNADTCSWSLAKLNVLYRLDKIDVGVFVTCIDKRSAAARIWPSSNRNGSLAELDAHNYWKNIIVPLWVYGFAPDGFDRSAPYLRRDGTLYSLVDTGRTRRIKGRAYRVFHRFGKERVFTVGPVRE